MRWKYSAHFEFEDLCDEGILNLGTDRKLSAAASVGHKAILEKNRDENRERFVFIGDAHPLWKWRECYRPLLTSHGGSHRTPHMRGVRPGVLISLCPTSA